MRRLGGLAALGLLLAGCPDKGAAPAPPPRDGRLGKQRCSGLPSKLNARLPVLQRPFDGAFLVLRLFDHHTPGVFGAGETGSRELTYCGLDILGLPEGHEGYAWALPSGTPVFPAADGVVTFAGTEPDAFCPLTRAIVGGQQSVEIRHEGLGGVGFATTYRHLAQVLVKVGDKVASAQRLGLSGQSGCTSEPALYFEVKRLSGNKANTPAVVDPYGWDGPADDPWAREPDGAPSLYLWKDGQAPDLGR